MAIDTDKLVNKQNYLRCKVSIFKITDYKEEEEHGIMYTGEACI